MLTWSRIKNGSDVIACFMLGRVETYALLLGRKKSIRASTIDAVVKHWRTCRRAVTSPSFSK